MRKITSLLMLLCVFAVAAWAEQVSPKITSPTLTAGNKVLIKGVGGRKGWAYKALGADNVVRMYLWNTENAPTTLSEEFMFTVVAGSEEGKFKLQSFDGNYFKANDTFTAVEAEATELSLKAKPNAESGVWNIVLPGTYLNMNATEDKDKATTPQESNFMATVWNDEGDPNGKWEVYYVGEYEEDEFKDALDALKNQAEEKKTELGATTIVKTEPVNVAIEALTNAIENASTDADLVDRMSQLNSAIALCNNITFQSGSLASFEDGEYVVYYTDASNVKHYLVNNKTTKRVISSTIPAVYDVTLGNVTGGYASHAYYFDMNESKMSNPTNNDAMEVQVEPKGGNNYAANRQWDSQVFYINKDGKYAIRSTNCVVGSGWKSDCFITVSEGAVKGQNTDLTDALYMWTVEKADENIAYSVDFSAAEYQTLYLNYAVQIPEGVSAYAVSAAEGNSATMAALSGVIPEKTPVVVKGTGSAKFVYTEPVEAYSGTNLLRGTMLASYIAPATNNTPYVLSIQDGATGFYKATLNKNASGAAAETHFLNNANKAYLLVEAPAEEPAAAPFFRFDFGTETAIESIQGVESANAVVYDLAGRRVQGAQKGLYIVNGKKVIK